MKKRKYGKTENRTYVKLLIDSPELNIREKKHQATFIIFDVSTEKSDEFFIKLLLKGRDKNWIITR